MDEGNIELTFIVELRKALHYLYDPVNLRRSILTRAFQVDKQPDPAMELRGILMAGVETLKPTTSVPIHAEAWRIYILLFRRYIEQFSQLEVAKEMNLSARHVRREESNALNVLGHSLWSRYNLETYWSGLKPGIALKEDEAVASEEEEHSTTTRLQEMEYLQASLPTEPVDLGEMLHGIIQTAEPLALASKTQIHYRRPEVVRHLAIQATTVRQALLITLSTSISGCEGGEIFVDVSFHEEYANLFIHSEKVVARAGILSPQDKENLNMARQLLVPSGGSLDFISQEKEPLVVKVILPLIGQISVLVVDDNADTQLLLQRYLTGTPYQFIGVRDSEQVVDLASRTAPRVIVLDVMLPGIDGWELLGRLREHPKTQAIPIVVCTILPQESLALTLGAAAFIRKPVSREKFLAVMDRLIGPSLK